MFINRVMSLISERGISKNRLLNDLSLNKNSFVNWQERGSIPSSDTVKRIADYFNVTIDYLLGNTDVKNQPSPERQKKADLMMQYLIERGIITEDYTPEDLARVADDFKTNSELIKQILENHKK